MYSELYTDECQIGAFEKHFRTSFLVHAMAHGREVKCNSSSHPNLGNKMNQISVVIPPLNFAGNPIRAVSKVEMNMEEEKRSCCSMLEKTRLPEMHRMLDAISPAVEEKLPVQL